MRVAMVAAALAVALGAVQLAGQSPVESRKLHKGRTADAASPQVATVQASGPRYRRPGYYSQLLTPHRRAVHIVQPLCDASSKDPAMAARALGTALLDIEKQVSALDKTATGNQKTALASYRSHESQARMHYEELMKSLSNPSATRQHAVAIRQALNAAGGALTTHTDSWTARQ